MKVFISGGCKNGKSRMAEDIAVRLSLGGPLYYMATMVPHDSEDFLRIERHRQSRSGKGFETVECADGLSANIRETCGTYLVDSVTALLANDYADPNKVKEDLKSFAASVKNAVFVSDFIYSADENYSDETKSYMRSLAECDRLLADICDTVMEIAAGCAEIYKGEMP